MLTQNANLVTSSMPTSSADPTVNLWGLNLSELTEIIAGAGEKPFRARQLFQWVHQKRVAKPSEMTDLAHSLRDRLPGMFSFKLPEVVTEKTSRDGTIKFVMRFTDGRTVETVIIPAEDRLTACLSSEVGCNMACRFCFTAQQKLLRRLSAHEIVGQFMVAQKHLGWERRISNIVFMGMGEPLDNTDAVLRSADILADDLGMNLSRRKITVSTSGIVTEIPKITAAKLRLAVSLNATSDEIRNRLMPINRKWPIHEVLAAAKQHALATRDRVTFEYILIRGETDSIADARKLFQITRSIPCKLNIIPFNEHPASDFRRPTESTINAFHQELYRLGAQVLRRKTMGRDILAACGQLNSTYSIQNEGESVGI